MWKKGKRDLALYSGKCCIYNGKVMSGSTGGPALQSPPTLSKPGINASQLRCMSGIPRPTIYRSWRHSVCSRQRSQPSGAKWKHLLIHLRPLHMGQIRDSDPVLWFPNCVPLCVSRVSATIYVYLTDHSGRAVLCNWLTVYGAD
jgi:hypothetical protein